MKKINYLITAIILTFTLTLYARHSPSETSWKFKSGSSRQLLPSLVKKFNATSVEQNRLF